MTFKEIVNALEEADIDSRDFYSEGQYACDYVEDKEVREALGKVKLVSEFAGGYNYELRNKVYHFVDHNVYMQLTGRYNSYEGITDYDGGFGKEVFPKEVSNIIYE
jgi:hypothetical protein